MAVLVKIKTNATLEQIEDSIRGYNTDINEISEDGVFEIYAAPYDRYHLSIESFLDVMESNLKYSDENITVELLESELV